MKYLATFYTHFDATKYHKYIRKKGAMASLNRSSQLSPHAEAVLFHHGPGAAFGGTAYGGDVERLYQVDGNDYLLLGEN